MYSERKIVDVTIVNVIPGEFSLRRFIRISSLFRLCSPNALGYASSRIAILFSPFSFAPSIAWLSFLLLLDLKLLPRSLGVLGREPVPGELSLASLRSTAVFPGTLFDLQPFRQKRRQSSFVQRMSFVFYFSLSIFLLLRVFRLTSLLPNLVSFPTISREKRHNQEGSRHLVIGKSAHHVLPPFLAILSTPPLLPTSYVAPSPHPLVSALHPLAPALLFCGLSRSFVAAERFRGSNAEEGETSSIS